MKITVNRFVSDDDATVSTVAIDGKVECFGLEDEPRQIKKAHETRIPAGVYNVTLRTVGGFNERYTRRFPAWHKGMLWVRDVPDFEFILIHIGNTDEDTSGCLLLGECATLVHPKKVLSSTNAYEAFYKKVADAAANNELTIEYIDSDLEGAG